jgi:hypothetical protein
VAGVAQQSKQTGPDVGYAEVDKAASGACSLSTALVLFPSGDISDSSRNSPSMVEVNDHDNRFLVDLSARHCVLSVV